MIIVITPELMVPNEAEIIHQLFQEGLDLLHIRKPFISNGEMKNFLEQIDSSHHSQLVLHSHYDCGKKYNISRLHIREKDRLNGLADQFRDQIISTSVHDIDSFNALEKKWEYSFISPVFPSISKKGYGDNTTVLENIRFRNNQDVKLIALGGINENNLHKALEAKIEGVALLGSIWESDQPIYIFKKCRQFVLS